MLSSEGKQLVSSLWSLTLKVENKSANEMVTLEAEHLTFDGGGGGACMVGDLRKKITLLQQLAVSLTWRLDREMRRRLILHETGFTR